MGKEKISQRTGKKILQPTATKLNPDAVQEIIKQVHKKMWKSKNHAINTAVEEKFIPEEKPQKEKK